VYKRQDSYIRFKLNKAVTAKITIKNSSGTTVKTLYKTARANTLETVKWDGKWASDGKAKKGTYYYVLTATDSAGYSVTSNRLTTYIKNYQLIRVGSGIRVIAR
jgi:flagellar hook assembly protein FlgD